jgi:hypothetical protein
VVFGNVMSMTSLVNNCLMVEVPVGHCFHEICSAHVDFCIFQEFVSAGIQIS